MHGFYILFPFDSCFSHIEVRSQKSELPAELTKVFFFRGGEQNWRDKKVIFMSLNNEISDVT